MSIIKLAHGDARLEIDPSLGNFPSWQIHGQPILHAAPWRDEPEVQNSDLETPGLRGLAGDFFCMPFCADDVGGDPAHGHPANAPWDVVEQGHAHARMTLSKPVRGASVSKEVRIAEHALYQSHVIVGGAGEVTLAHHPMARMAAGGRLSFSPKRMALTDPLPQYLGQNLWALGQIRPDLRLACEDGKMWDLHEYPAQHAVEDFVILVEARGARLGWTVLIREHEDDMLVVLKDARQLPVTMLWISNGGRDFAPWNSRHIGVIGIEDGIAAGATGLKYALGDNPVKAANVATTLALGGTTDIRHAMVHLPRPPGWSRVTEVAVAKGRIALSEASGATVDVAFDDTHFAP
ncbi:MAG: hypothetical protein AAGA70_11165 [Pseudomonadota bacterium]